MVPYGHNEIRELDGQRTGQMNSVGSSERVHARKIAGVTLDCGGEFNWLDRCPEQIPVSLNFPQRTSVDSVISRAGGERGANLWVRKAARQGTVAPIPESGGEVAAFFIDDELYQSAGVDVDQCHSRLLALFSDEVGYRGGASNTSVSSC